MYRQKRDDTYVGTIEATYGLNLHARADMLLGNLLEERGFDSLSQLLIAYRGRATSHARRRRIFLSFHVEDKNQINGFRLMTYNSRVEIDFSDLSVRSPVNSENSSYVKNVIRRKISSCSVIVCLIGNGTAWRDWVDWELSTGILLHKGICGIRLKGSRGRAPDIIKKYGFPVAQWNLPNMVAAIECAAARRS
jgi:hypothetical protein